MLYLEIGWIIALTFVLYFICLIKLEAFVLIPLDFGTILCISLFYYIYFTSFVYFSW